MFYYSYRETFINDYEINIVDRIRKGDKPRISHNDGPFYRSRTKGRVRVESWCIWSKVKYSWIVSLSSIKGCGKRECSRWVRSRSQ